MNRTTWRRKHGLHRHPIIGNTTKTAMHRLLETATERHGNVEPDYHHQWKTIWKAKRLGFIEEGGSGHIITAKGIEELKRLQIQKVTITGMRMDNNETL